MSATSPLPPETVALPVDQELVLKVIPMPAGMGITFSTSSWSTGRATVSGGRGEVADMGTIG